MIASEDVGYHISDPQRPRLSSAFPGKLASHGVVLFVYARSYLFALDAIELDREPALIVRAEDAIGHWEEHLVLLADVITQADGVGAQILGDKSRRIRVALARRGQCSVYRPDALPTALVLLKHDRGGCLHSGVAFTQSGEKRLLLFGVMAAVGEVLAEINHARHVVGVDLACGLDLVCLALHRLDYQHHELMLVLQDLSGGGRALFVAGRLFGHGVLLKVDGAVVRNTPRVHMVRMS